MYIKNAKLLFTMTLFEARRFTMYPTEAAAAILARLFEMLLYITFWLLVGKYAGSGNVSATQVISYYLIINGITSFFFTQMGIGSMLIKMIKHGELNQVLIRPVSPLLVPWSQRAGRNLLSQIIGGLQVIVGVVLASSLSVHSSAWLPLILFNTLVLNLAFNFIIGTMGFYLVEAGGVKNAFLHIYNLCGGVLMPLFLMPASVAEALQYTPFPAAQYHLAITLQGIYPVSGSFIIVGSVWAAGLMTLALWFWRRSLRYYEAIGI